MTSRHLNHNVRLTTKIGFGILVVSAVTAAVAPSAFANANYPSQAITLVVPFGTGGGTDLVARVIGQKMSEDLGQPVVVENKSGVNGNIGSSYVAKAKPDGYTVLYNTSSIAISPALYKNLNYEVTRDLLPVGLSATIPMVLVVSPEVPANTLKEFIRYAKANESKLSYGSSGVGNITQLTAFQFMRANNLNITHIPYRGSGPANVDLAGNHIQFMTDTLNNVASFVRDNRMKLLAVATNERQALFPDVPTFDEAGMPNFEAGAWSGVMVPAGTPKEIVDRLNKALRAALASPDVREKLAQQGTIPLGSTPDEYAAYLTQEMKRWDEVVKQADIKLD